METIKTLMNIHVHIFYIIGLFVSVSSLLVNGFEVENKLLFVLSILTIIGLILWLVGMVRLVHEVICE